MKRLLVRLVIIVLPVLFFFNQVNAQIHSVVFNGSWSSALSPGFSMSKAARNDIKINKAAGWGADLGVRYSITDRFIISISGGYQFYAIDQDSALGRWGWKFWETRYKGNVRDMLNSDTTLKADLQPRETMESYPVFINCSYSFYETAPFTFSAHAGVGVIFYYRKFMLEETWSKYYPAAGYTYLYSFRDFAPTKAGNPIALKIGAECDYRISEIFGVNSAVSYLQIIDSGRKLGYDNFPFHRAVQAKLGLTIYY